MTTYLDHAATSPLRPSAAARVAEATAAGGNASSLHASGRRARRFVEDAREEVAALLGARPTEVVFTAGGTEADNLAVKGLFRARHLADPARTVVLVAGTEHHAVLDPVDHLARTAGAEVVTLPVDGAGRVAPEAVAEALAVHAGRVALVSLMWANNEVGTVQPVEAVAETAAAAGVPLHVDAVQAVGQLPVDLGRTPVAALTVSAHKLGGPLGVGALVVRRGTDLEPVLHGGGQEGGVRSGTLPTPLVAGFGAAAVEVAASRADEAVRLAHLRDLLVAAVRAAAPDAVLRGCPDPAGRLPGNAHFTFPGCEGDSLLYLLDAHGIECSTGSACRAGVPEPSHVLLAMGVPLAETRGALRFSLGWSSTRADVDALAEALPGVLARARRAGATA